MLGNGPIVVTAFRGLVSKMQGVLTGLYTPQGVDNYDPAATEGYFIGVDPSFSGRLHLLRILNPGGNPTTPGGYRLMFRCHRRNDQRASPREHGRQRRQFGWAG